MSTLHGSHEAAYSELPKYCIDIIRTNPGSIAIVECTTEIIENTENKDQYFKRMFVCYSASATGFTFCRPVLGLDGTHLKGGFQGILLCATGVDANGSLFPLGYGIVDAENDDNWQWFVKLLHDVQMYILEFLDIRNRDPQAAEICPNLNEVKRGLCL